MSEKNDRIRMYAVIFMSIKIRPSLEHEIQRDRPAQQRENHRRDEHFEAVVALALGALAGSFRGAAQIRPVERHEPAAVIPTGGAGLRSCLMYERMLFHPRPSHRVFCCNHCTISRPYFKHLFVPILALFHLLFVAPHIY